MNYIENNYEELFDITYDPHETENLAKNGKYKLILEELRTRYKELKTQHGVPESVWKASNKKF
jgi:hypothetical protein